MDPEGSVSRWLAELRTPERSTAQQELWNRYFQRLVGLARKRLGDTPRRAMDEEDVALSTLNSFFDDIQQGRYPDLGERTGLWTLLASITARKAINQRHFETCAKRGGGKVRGDSVAGEYPFKGEAGRTFDRFPGDDLPPDDLVAISEECRRLMDALPSDQLRRIAQMKLEGCTNAEIAAEMRVVERTIERKLEVIRNRWSATTQSQSSLSSASSPRSV